MSINVRQIRFALWGFASLYVAGGAAIAWVCMVLPLDQPGEAKSAHTQSSVRPTDGLGPLPLSAYATIWDIDLRRSLVDAPPSPSAAVEQTTAEPTPPQFHLAGTVVEPGHSVALFQSPVGKTEFRSVGQEFNGARLAAINDGSTTLEWNGRQIVISVERATPTSPAAKPDEDRR